MKTEFASLNELFEAIPDEQAAIKYLAAIRWANGEFCPYCGHGKIYSFKDGKWWKCAKCCARFSIRIGTVFQDSNAPLRKWLAAVWMITSNGKDVATTELVRDIGIPQGTAWAMLDRLRHAAQTCSFNRPLDGPAEVDAAYRGRSKGNKSRDQRTTTYKIVATSMLERGGKLRPRRIRRSEFATNS